MSETPEIKLNEFGDLSRRQRRELEAKGIDPDTAVIEYLNTQSIPIQRPAEDVVESVAEVTITTSDIPVVPLDVPTTTAEIFPAAMSSREIRNVLDRVDAVEEMLAPGDQRAADTQETVTTGTNSIPVVIAIPTPSVSPEVPEGDAEEDLPLELQADTDVVAELASEAPAKKAVDTSEYVVETYSGPTTISEATAAAALEEAIAAHHAARVDNGVDLDIPMLDASDYEDFSGPSTGSIPTISNALILPTLPEDTGTIIPIVATGEIIVTEQLTLPSSIAQVGAEFGTLDTSELDFIDDEAKITPSQDLAPVRAASAVSSYNANNAVVTVPKRMSDRLPLVLSITAGGLAIAVVALFVTGYFLGLF